MTNKILDRQFDVIVEMLQKAGLFMHRIEDSNVALVSFDDGHGDIYEWVYDKKKGKIYLQV